MNDKALGTLRMKLSHAMNEFELQVGREALARQAKTRARCQVGRVFEELFRAAKAAPEIPKQGEEVRT